MADERELVTAEQMDTMTPDERAASSEIASSPTSMSSLPKSAPGSRKPAGKWRVIWG